MNSYIFGKKSIINALENHQPIIVIKTAKKIDDFNKYSNIKQEIVTKNFFQQFKNVNHQFCIAILKDSYHFIDVNQLLSKAQTKNKTTYVILDNIEDPQNFGAILRSCVAFGVDAVIFKNKHQAPINEVVVKASLGAVNLIDLCIVSNINLVIEKLKKVGYWVYATTLNSQSQLLNEIDFDSKSVIIFGNESKGISELTQKLCDYAIKIPLSNQVQSLNVSVACGIVLYRRWHKP